jgi:hypothetical protein
MQRLFQWACSAAYGYWLFLCLSTINVDADVPDAFALSLLPLFASGAAAALWHRVQPLFTPVYPKLPGEIQ